MSTLRNIKRTRFAASWNSARYYEQVMLNEAVPRLWQVHPLTRPGTPHHKSSNVRKSDKTNITDEVIMEELNTYDDTFDINFDDDQPVHAWLRELTNIQLTEKEATALKPFVELVTPSKIGLFSQPPLSLFYDHLDTKSS